MRVVLGPGPPPFHHAVETAGAAAASRYQLAAAEAESGEVTKTAGWSAFDLHPSDLARILDHAKIPTAGDGERSCPSKL